MSLEVRKYKFEEGDSHDIFEVELIPEVVDGVEVYNIEENMVISNSNIKGKIYLQNISGIDCAILENSTIVASKSMPIEDAEIKEKNIQDYYLYQKSFRNHIEQEQKDIGKADAQNWEVL